MKLSHLPRSFFRSIHCFLLAGLFASFGLLRADDDSSASSTSIWDKSNLFAWCVVPFDAKHRNSEQRADMLERLGFTKFAYDWRDENIPTFDAEIEAMQNHHIDIIAWWFNGSPQAQKAILEACKRHHIHPQMWFAWGGPVDGSTEQNKNNLQAMTATFKSLDAMCRPYDCPVEIYSHNGWGGNEDNELAVLDQLKESGITDIGLVYNFSHAHDNDHDDTQDFPALWAKIEPHVVAINITGMQPAWQAEIYPGAGTQELGMMKTIQDSGWKGPVGLIAEKGGDAEVTLGNYLKGLDWLVHKLKNPNSSEPSPFSSIVPGKFGNALDASNSGILLPNQDAFRTPPLTVEFWARLHGTDNFNVLLASDPKASSQHWEVYSNAKDGVFSAFLPGRGGVFNSTTNICDNAWHYLAMVMDTDHLNLYVDGNMVKEGALTELQGTPQPGDFAIGQLDDGSNASQGLIDDIRISKGTLTISGVPNAPFRKDGQTLALWSLDTLPTHS